MSISYSVKCIVHLTKTTQQQQQRFTTTSFIVDYVYPSFECLNETSITTTGNAVGNWFEVISLAARVRFAQFSLFLTVSRNRVLHPTAHWSKYSLVNTEIPAVDTEPIWLALLQSH